MLSNFYCCIFFGRLKTKNVGTGESERAIEEHYIPLTDNKIPLLILLGMLQSPLLYHNQNWWNYTWILETFEK